MSRREAGGGRRGFDWLRSLRKRRGESADPESDAHGPLRHLTTGVPNGLARATSTVCKELIHNAAEVESQLPDCKGEMDERRRIGVKTAVFRRWTGNEVEETWRHAGEISVHVVPGSNQITVAVAGRVTVDSSPNLRSALLEFVRRGTSPMTVIDLSGVSYLDTSGLATLLEALKAARQHSVKLRVSGITGKARNLAEIAQLDTIFRAWGSEVEFR